MRDDETVPRDSDQTELDLIRLHYPALSWRTARRVTEGWDHVVLLLGGCSGPDSRGHPDLVFRFPDGEYAPLLEREVAALDLVAPLVEVSVPRYSHREFISVGHDTPVFGGYPTIGGSRLTPGLFRTLHRSDVTVIADRLGGLLTELHRQDTSTPPLDGLPPAWPVEDRHHLREIATEELPSRLAADEMREVYAILDGLDELLDDPVPPVFLHGDVYSAHLFWEPGRLGVIDFADMCVGDPAIDVAELFEFGPRFVDDVLARYRGPLDDGLLDRAWAHQRLVALYMLTDHIELGKQSWAQARETFDRCRSPRRPRA